MHLSDGHLSTVMCGVTQLGAVAALGLCVSRGRRTLPQQLALVPATAALVFGLQMLNVDVPGTEMSVHALGGALAGALVGPWWGALCVATVLGVQATVFADGGLLTLGANILNMACLGAMLGGYSRHLLYGTAAVRAGIAGACSVIGGVLLCASELVASQAADVTVLGTLLRAHVPLVVGEGLFTAAVVAAVAETRPLARGVSKVVLGGALLAAGLLSPLASTAPDALEFVSVDMGFANRAHSHVLLWDDYALPAPGPYAATSFAGVLGVMLCLVLAKGIAVVGQRTQPLCEPATRVS